VRAPLPTNAWKCQFCLWCVPNLNLPGQTVLPEKERSIYSKQCFSWQHPRTIIEQKKCTAKNSLAVGYAQQRRKQQFTHWMGTRKLWLLRPMLVPVNSFWILLVQCHCCREHERCGPRSHGDVILHELSWHDKCMQHAYPNKKQSQPCSSRHSKRAKHASCTDLQAISDNQQMPP